MPPRKRGLGLSMGYKLSDKAFADVIEIYSFGVGKFGKLQAERFYDGLLLKFAKIAQNPKLCRERKEAQPPVRVFSYSGHLIVYIIQSKNVLILRVLHGHYDWQSDFSED